MKKILIIRFSSIGDIVLTTPVVRCLKKKYGESVIIHFLTKKAFEGILENNPYIDKVIGIDKSVNEVMSFLRKEKYNQIVDLHKNIRSKRVVIGVKVKCTSFSKINLQKWLAVNTNINILPNKHIVDRYFESVRNLDVENDGLGLDYFINAKDEISFKSLPDSFHNGFIGIVIGAKHETKQVPIEKVIEICNMVSKPVILMGGEEDYEKGEKIISKVNNVIFNSCGKFTIGQTASLIGLSEIIITADTGLMHIAAALEKPLITIWGNTVPEFGMSAYMPKKNEYFVKILEIKDLVCRPCSKIGFNSCPKKHFKCMLDIDADTVVGFVEKFYKNDFL